jgi:PHD/YefM family antitoxin component YafN of YafNO toxin-antitoxin module
MQRFQMTEANRNPDAIWRAATREPVTVEEGGKPVAIVLSPQAYSDLLASHNQRVVVGHRHGTRLTVDSNELFGFAGDVFCNEDP